MPASIRKLFSTDHHEETTVHPNAIEHSGQTSRGHYDEPFCRFFPIPTYYVSKTLRDGQVTVASVVDAVMKVLAGYRRYQIRLYETAWKSRFRRVAPHEYLASRTTLSSAGWAPAWFRAQSGHFKVVGASRWNGLSSIQFRIFDSG